ncbi:glycosyltransferase involved in cell wall biosynthesis [Haloferula luteola]|uniref:Glycosyltransferase involved in cell wall biosynthesis n=1 Tax=Haloferula luteola TaxID=595692 RepID=A0A840V1F9_9BACT|nr:glycosyltransferase family 1 protein [Haloferula luteola]MBB5350896.1 glycosyltransferase involved in cell wall biosynthesis [Haloferula luteola]
MKVGLTATMVQGGKSGVAQYVFALVRELMKRKDLELFVFVLEDERKLFDFARDHCELVEVPREFAPPVKNILWHQLRLPGMAGELQLDVLHVPSYRRLVRKAPCPTVGTIHDLAPFHVRGKYDVARMFYGRVVVKDLARRQDGLIAVSHCTAQDIERFFGIPQEGIEVIHNGIDHHRFQPGEPAAARAWMASKHAMDAPFFLYISRLEHPGKNHVRLIEAFNQFKCETGSDWQLALGGGEWHGAEAIHAAAAASPFAKDIRFLGFVPDGDLATIYQASRCMVYPSLFEGFGLPPVEAMACGTPVISSTRGALEEVVADAARVIDPEDVADMARALVAVASDPAEAGALREKGLANAQRFVWAHAADRVVEVYRRVQR